MLIYLLFISGMYLALGFSVGWKVTRPIKADWELGDHTSAESENEIPHGPKDNRGEIIYQVQELPPQWVEQLESVHECRSFVEATTQILTLEVGRYRDSLVDLDSRIRRFLDDPENPNIDDQAVESAKANQEKADNEAADPTSESSVDAESATSAEVDTTTDTTAGDDAAKGPAAPATIDETIAGLTIGGENEGSSENSESVEQPVSEIAANGEPAPSDDSASAVPGESGLMVVGAKTIIQIKRELLTLNQNWLNRQSEANDVLTSKHDAISTQKGFADQLQHIVASQMAQVETSASNIANFPDEMPPVECAQRLVLELGVMLKLTHKLRDLILETMCDILETEDRIGTCSEESLHDNWTGTRNRVGLSVIHKQWCSENEDKDEPLAYVLFDIDGFHKLNAQLGARLCDHFVTSIGKSIDGLLRKRGLYDITTRISGQQYLVMLGNTNVSGARNFAERVRQTISQHSFEHQKGDSRITLTCGVTDFRKDDTLKSMIGRLHSCLDVGKESERNCVVVDDGTGTERMDALSIDIKELNTRIDNFIQEDANTPALTNSGHR